MTDKDPRRAAPFSRMIDVASVGAGGQRITIEAGEAERHALGLVNGLLALDRLTADLQLRREGRTGIAVTGTVKAIVRRTCVVTLEDFDADLVEPVEIHFLPAREVESMAVEAAAHPAPAEIDADEPDLPDPIVNGRIDLGAVAAEFLALGLDPYPKKPGAAFVEPAENAVVVSPFAALARLNQPGKS